MVAFSRALREEISSKMSFTRGVPCFLCGGGLTHIRHFKDGLASVIHIIVTGRKNIRIGTKNFRNLGPMTPFPLQGDHITLAQAVKAVGLADSGGQAKQLVRSGAVQVNGTVE